MSTECVSHTDTRGSQPRIVGRDRQGLLVPACQEEEQNMTGEGGHLEVVQHFQVHRGKTKKVQE